LRSRGVPSSFRVSSPAWRRPSGRRGTSSPLSPGRGSGDRRQGRRRRLVDTARLLQRGHPDRARAALQPEVLAGVRVEKLLPEPGRRRVRRGLADRLRVVAAEDGVGRYEDLPGRDVRSRGPERGSAPSAERCSPMPSSLATGTVSCAGSSPPAAACLPSSAASRSPSLSSRVGCRLGGGRAGRGAAGGGRPAGRCQERESPENDADPAMSMVPVHVSPQLLRVRLIAAGQG
jgi:hypothetical protein